MKLPKKKPGKRAFNTLGLTLKTQLMLIYGLLFTLLTTFSCVLINIEIGNASKHQADTIGELLSEQTASAAANMLVTGDRLSLSALLNQLVQNPYVSEASIYSIDNHRMARAESRTQNNGENNTKGNGPVYSAPINYQDVIAGYVRLYLNQDLLTHKPKEAIQIIVAVSALLLLAGLILLNIYGGKLSQKLKLIERQLHSILSLETMPPKATGEIDSISEFVEKQLTEKLKTNQEEEVDAKTEEISAILSIRAKNIGRLQQLLAPSDLVGIIRQQLAITEEATKRYGGTLSYTPEGNGYIRFSSLESNTFSLDAICCGLLIVSLSQVTTEQSIAKIQLGLGLCLSDQITEFPEEQHPAVADSAASQALMLASLPEPDGLHMLRKQLSWLPADLVDVDVSDHGDDIIYVSSINSPEADKIAKQVTEIEAHLP